MADKKINPIEAMATGRLKPGDISAEMRRVVHDWAGEAKRDDLVKALDITLLLLGKEGRRAELLRQEAYKDPLTQIGNRRYLMEELSSGLELSSLFRSVSQVGAIPGTKKALVYIDLVGLTAINKKGQGAGDAALRAVGERLNEIVRGNEVCARTGGDEFACLIDLEPSGASGEKVRQRLEDGFKNLTYNYEGEAYPVRIYTAVFPVNPKLDAEENFRIAGEQLAEAKKRDRVGREFLEKPDAEPS